VAFRVAAAYILIVKLLWTVVLLAIVLGLLVILGHEPQTAPSTPATSQPTSAAIRIGLIPEQDIFALRKRHQILADYIASELGRPVELVTGNSYETVLKDFAEKKIEAALLGSLVTVLCVDRLDARVIAKTEMPGGVSTYHGVMCVPKESPITSVEQLAGKSIALVRTTTGGNLFPIHEMLRLGLLHGEDAPRIVWVGTHDDAMDTMIKAATSAAAAKSLRIEAWTLGHPGRDVRILATSGEVPENALVIRGDVADTLGAQLSRVVLDMDKSDAGRAALREYGAARFLPCDITEYKVIYDLVADLGDEWQRLGISGAAPKPLPGR